MNRPPLTVLLALSVLAPAGAALAQDRGPVERQQLLELAFTMGQSHGLRQLCEGAGDQYWRSRMVRLTEVEKADQAFDAQLRDRFNTGFAAGQGQFTECDADSRKAEQVAARKGQALASRLARSMVVTNPANASAPDSVAEDQAPR